MEQTLTLPSLPSGLRSALRALLLATPGVTFVERGWGFFPKDLVITGPASTLEALKPRIQAIEAEYVSREAW